MVRSRNVEGNLLIRNCATFQFAPTCLWKWQKHIRKKTRIATFILKKKENVSYFLIAWNIFLSYALFKRFLLISQTIITRHFFNNCNTNEDIATKFEQDYVRCVRNEGEWRAPSFREDWCLVWDVPSAHNWSHLLRSNRHNSCIYGNLQTPL